MQQQEVDGKTSTSFPNKGHIYFWPGNDRYSFLDNTYHSSFDVAGKQFKSVWWYMWYARARAWRPGTELAKLIMEADSEKQAKQLSRRCTTPPAGQISTWTVDRLRIMAQAVLRKFQCSSELAEKLIWTGSDVLLYASRFDAKFGIGFTMKEGIHRPEDWGENCLGRILMIVRQRLVEGMHPDQAGGALVSQMTICSIVSSPESEEKCRSLSCVLCGRSGSSGSSGNRNGKDEEDGKEKALCSYPEGALIGIEQGKRKREEVEIGECTEQKRFCTDKLVDVIN